MPIRIIQRMGFACWTRKATNTRSQFVIGLHVAFPEQQWLYERASVLRYTYTSCLVSERDSYEELQHIWRFMFVPCFTTSLLVGGLCVEDRENCFSQVPIVLHVIYFFADLGAKGSLPVKTKSTLRTGTTNSKYFSGVPLNFLKNSVEPVSSKFQKFECKVMTYV